VSVQMQYTESEINIARLIQENCTMGAEWQLGLAKIWTLGMIVLGLTLVPTCAILVWK
jgi:hypothetical protein